MRDKKITHDCALDTIYLSRKLLRDLLNNYFIYITYATSFRYAGESVTKKFSDFFYANFYYTRC